MRNRRPRSANKSKKSTKYNPRKPLPYNKYVDEGFINTAMMGYPSPDTYPEDITYKASGPHYSFGKDKCILRRPKTPGPGEYETNGTTLKIGKGNNTLYRTGRETYMTQIIKEAARNQTAESGDYFARDKYGIENKDFRNLLYRSTEKHKFSKDDKLKFLNRKVPGVGEYFIDRAEHFGLGDRNKFSIPKAKRTTYFDREKEPIQKRKYKESNYGLFGREGPKPTMAGKGRVMKPLDTPGPGKYYIPCSFASSPPYFQRMEKTFEKV